jgi:hypothetical protein
LDTVVAESIIVISMISAIVENSANPLVVECEPVVDLAAKNKEILLVQ